MRDSVGRARAALVAVALSLCAVCTPPATGTDLAWPLAGHDQFTTPIAATYGQYIHVGAHDYTHTGVDIKAPAGTVAVPGLVGTVKEVHDPDFDPPRTRQRQGIVVTETATGADWLYWHVADFRLAAGAPVGPTTPLASVYDYGPLWNHLHLGIGSPAEAVGNPLSRLTYVDTLAPTLADYRLYPNGAEGIDAFFEATVVADGQQQVLVGQGPRATPTAAVGADTSEIDLAVSAYDRIDGSDYRVGLYRMGYRIDPAGYLPASAGVEPHTTFRFEGITPRQSSGIRNTLYRDDDGLTCDSADDWTGAATLGAGTFWHIVTNTDDTSPGGDGDSAHLNRTATRAMAWKTRGGATVNADARSPDGEYTIVVSAADRAGNAAERILAVRVDNFEQVAGVKGPRGQFVAPPLDGPAGSATATAAISPVRFRLGEEVFLSAAQLLGDAEVTAYLQHHQGRAEGQAIAAGAIAEQTFTTDATGTLNWSPMWTADQEGTFDILVDYDNDGRFSYSLDALIGLTVVPEPSGLALAGAGMVALAGTRRRRPKGPAVT